MAVLALNEKPTGPLSGVRILEWAANYTGPLAALGLADQGAEVIKVESPAGDQMRGATAYREGVTGMAASFAIANRNKRSIVLDVKKPGALDALKKLISQADVVIQNFRPGVIESLGLGYEEMKKIKPDIILASISGFGTSGPYSEQKVYDPIVQAVSGLMSAQRDPDDQIPTIIRSSVVDKLTGMVGCQAVTAALYAHAKTGKGQHVEIDMLSAALAFNWADAMLNYMWMGDGVKKGGGMADARYIYKTKDGYICALSLGNQEWANLVTALERPDLITDPRFPEFFDRLGRQKEVFAELSPSFLKRTTKEWLEILKEHDTVCGPVNREETLHEDAQIVHGGLLVETEHPHAGMYRQPLPAVKFRGTPSQIRSHAPMLGEHTDAILKEAGFGDDQIKKLHESGAAIQR